MNTDVESARRDAQRFLSHPTMAPGRPDGRVATLRHQTEVAIATGDVPTIRDATRRVCQMIMRRLIWEATREGDLRWLVWALGIWAKMVWQHLGPARRG